MSLETHDGIVEQGTIVATLTAGDVEVGAVEIKDQDTDIRADVADGVTYDRLLTQIADGTTMAGVLDGATHDALKTALTDGVSVAAIIATILSLKTDLSSVAGTAALAGAGDTGAGSPRVTIATNDINQAAIKSATSAVQTFITNYRAAIAAAAPTDVVQVGGQVQTGVPAAAANNTLVPLLVDPYRRLVPYGANLGEGTIDVSVQSTPGKPVPLIEATWDALADPGVTPTLDVRSWKNFTVQWVVTSVDTSVDLIIWVSINNGVSFFQIVPTIQLLVDTTDFLEVDNFACTHLYCEFSAEAGGNAAAVQFYVCASD